MTLGELIKLSRKKQNMTQPELAGGAQIEQSYLSKLENDICSPSFEVIQKVAAALNSDAIEMIGHLDPIYISENMAHIPEVVTEISKIKKRHIQNFKRRFISAAFTLIVAIGIFMIGQMNFLFPETIYTYYSDGVIKKGEPILQFDPRVIKEIGESADNSRIRLQNNAKRFDRKFLQFNFKQPSSFIVNVEGGQRFYQYSTQNLVPDIRNKLITIFGVMVFVSGLFGFWYIFKFRE